MVALVLFASTAKGEEAPIFLEADQPAPFSGDLLTPKRSATLIAKIELCEQRAVIELERHQSLERQLRKNIENIKADNDDLRAWWRSPAFVAGAASLTTILMVLATGAALKEVSR